MNKPPTYKVHVNMMKALPKEVLAIIWRYYYSGAVLKELYVKTARTGLINTPSSIRWRIKVGRTAVFYGMGQNEVRTEQAKAKEARRAREQAIRKRDFEDWFALTGSTTRLSKRPKHFSDEDGLGDF